MYQKILVAVDVSREKNAAKLCEAANSLAKLGGGVVRLVAVVPDYGMPMVASYFPEGAQDGLKKEMGAALDKLADEHINGEVSVALRQGKRATKVLGEAQSWEPDIIVLGCRRKASRDNYRVFGSFSSSVTDRANCSVLVVR